MNQFKDRKDTMEPSQMTKSGNAAGLYAAPENKLRQGVEHFMVKRSNNRVERFDLERIKRTIAWASAGYEQEISVEVVLKELGKNIFDGIADTQIADALILAMSAFIENDPAYGYATARLLFKKLYRQVTGKSVFNSDVDHVYTQTFITNIKLGVECGIYTPELLEFDLEQLALSLVPERDHLFDFMGLRTLYERYFASYEKRFLELPQIFWMRVAMGLAMREKHKNSKAIEFYNVMSLLNYVPSTPTLLHSALLRPQLSSCFLGTVEDDLHHIFKCIGDQAQMSKWSGGVAYDWSNIRATGSMVKSIKAESQGVVPFLKIANDTTAAINRSGKRRSASVVYLESWHMEIEDFLDLRRNTGDERRRTHDINTANWIPDLLMKRIREDGMWTLFSPEETPDLHHIYGKAFELRYVEYETQALEGKFEQYKQIPAKDLWRKMLSRLFETGHPWITFKDAFNIRSPQDHAGVIHNTNLCTEISLNNSADETAVCNLGSVNLTRHIVNGQLDTELIEQTVSTAINMLDNIIDINFYPTKETENANLRHRPIGLGIMGFQDALYKMDIAFDDPRALIFADTSMELISYHAILSSSKLAKERGTYQSYKGSKWDRNIFPQDTIDLLQKERGVAIPGKRTGQLDWAPVREHVRQYGMRNSNTMAVAPTATISNISGCFPCIEPIYKNIYVKANMSGEFTVVNKYLITDLKKLSLWNQDMLDQLKYYDGNVQMIESIPLSLKNKYKEAFEIDPLWTIELVAARGKWIDQSQSFNVFLRSTSGKLLSDVYMTAWESGLKSCYYLRTMGATQIEKSTLDAKKFGYTQKRDYKSVGSEAAADNVAPVEVVAPQDAKGAVDPIEEPLKAQACSLSASPECDVCQ